MTEATARCVPETLVKPERCRESDAAILAAVINWNGWQDTILCVQSLFQLNGPCFELVICDNASDNGSIEHLAEWLTQSGGKRVWCNDLDGGARVIRYEGPFSAALTAVHLLQLPRNFGYAGAINHSILWGRQGLRARHFWVLNNDVRCDADALSELVAVAASQPKIGLIGSVLTDWDAPDAVQAIGGAYRPWIAVGQHMTAMPDSPPRTPAYCHVDYPVGASLFVTEDFLKAVGLMDDRYFLYYEEMDWAERGRRLGFRPAVALNSRLEHKEGASTGSHGGVRNKSLLSEHYGVVNRLRITRKLWPVRLPVVWLSLWLVAFDRFVHAEWARCALIVRLMFQPSRWLRDNT